MAKDKQNSENATVKKWRANLEGITIAEKILRNIVLAGIHSLNGENQKLFMEQTKELESYYISGIQSSLFDLIAIAGESQKDLNSSKAISSLNYLYALLKKSRTHTENKIADYSLGKKTDSLSHSAMINSSIEEQMGYAWKLSELKQEGKMIENARLLQVGYFVIEDEIKERFEDYGIWFCLNNGEIYIKTKYRTFASQQYIKEDGIFYPLHTIKELYVYPGEKNPRARWEEKSAVQEIFTSEDLEAARKAGRRDFAEVIKEVKEQIKIPIADKNPVFSLHIEKLGIENATSTLCVIDEKGIKIPLQLELFGFLMKHISRRQAEGNTLICRFDHDLESDILWAIPVALITKENLIKFMY
jgi:hypothetical protein